MLPDHPVSIFHSVRRYKTLFRLGFILLFLSSLLARSIHSARSQTFQCRNGHIILKSQQCDGHDDCDNAEDDCGSKRDIGGGRILEPTTRVVRVEPV